MAEVAARTREVRDVLGDAYLQVTVPGTFNHVGPTSFTDEHAFELSAAGADGMHVHLPSVDEIGRVTALAHKYGMLVEAYIFEFVAATEPFSYMGVPADSPSEARRVAQQLQDIGVDIIGLMFSTDPKYYATAGSPDVLPRNVAEKIRAIADSISVPMSVEGQITPANAPQLKDLGVNILVLGSEFDDGIEGAIRSVAEGYGIMPRGEAADSGPQSAAAPESLDRLRTRRSRPLRRPGVWGQAPGSVTRR